MLGCLLGWSVPTGLILPDDLVGSVILVHAASPNLGPVILVRNEGWRHASIVLLI